MKRRTALDNVEQQFEPVVHVELLMTMEKRQAVNRRRHIDFDLPESFHKHDILQDSSRPLAMNLREFEAIAV